MVRCHGLDAASWILSRGVDRMCRGKNLSNRFVKIQKLYKFVGEKDVGAIS